MTRNSRICDHNDLDKNDAFNYAEIGLVALQSFFLFNLECCIKIETKINLMWLQPAATSNLN